MKITISPRKCGPISSGNKARFHRDMVRLPREMCPWEMRGRWFRMRGPASFKRNFSLFFHKDLWPWTIKNRIKNIDLIQFAKLDMILYVFSMFIIQFEVILTYTNQFGSAQIKIGGCKINAAIILTRIMIMIILKRSFESHIRSSENHIKSYKNYIRLSENHVKSYENHIKSYKTIWNHMKTIQNHMKTM